MDPRSDVGRVDGCRAAAVAGDTAAAATPATGGETWVGSLAELF